MDNSCGLAVVLIYEFLPCATTLEREHLKQSSDYIAEDVLWSYLIQLVSAIQYVHSSNLSCRTISPSSVLLYNRNKLSINQIATPELVQSDLSPSDLLQAQVPFLSIFLLFRTLT